MIILPVIGFFFAFLFCIAYLTLFERKVIAAMQLRKGPNTTGPFGLLQPIADGIKLLHKETIVPQTPHAKIFMLSPIVLFTLSFSCWSVIPFQEKMVFSNLNVGLLYVIAISSLNIYSIILAGWSSGSYYAFLGAMRSVAQMISYEAIIGFILIAIIMRSQSFNLLNIVFLQKNMWNFIPFFPLWIIFFICSLAETNRAPFDLPESEAELVSGYNVEYSSFSYALFYLSEYGNMMLMSSLNAILFMGGWLPPCQALSFIPGIVWFMLKILFFLFLFIWIRATLPRFRYDQLMSLTWKVFLPFMFVFILIFGGILVYS
jgi:NADH-quinone oxidoreductase subunit H